MLASSTSLGRLLEGGCHLASGRCLDRTVEPVRVSRSTQGVASLPLLPVHPCLTHLHRVPSPCLSHTWIGRSAVAQPEVQLRGGERNLADSQLQLIGRGNGNHITVREEWLNTGQMFSRTGLRVLVFIIDVFT